MKNYTLNSSTQKTKKIIYIAGYGRSGSTLLERILGTHKKCFGTGELAQLVPKMQEQNPECSCGKKIENCNFWGNITKLIRKKYNLNKIYSLQLTQESILGVFKRFFLSTDEYSQYNEGLFGAIFENTTSEIEFIIDSSKTARKRFFRPFLLNNLPNTEVKLIHLVRDPRGCMHSNLKGSNKKMEKGQDPKIKFAVPRTILHWPLANLSPHLFQLSSSDNYLRISYENFVSNPKNTLQKTGQFLDINLDRQIEALENKQAIPVSHQIAGNRLRKKKKIVLRKNKKWKKKLNKLNKFLALLFLWPLIKLYY